MKGDYGCMKTANIGGVGGEIILKKKLFLLLRKT